MELRSPITTFSWRMATHTASVIIEASQLNYLPELLDGGIAVAPFTFSGSESIEKKWKATFDRDYDRDNDCNYGYGSQFRVMFNYTEPVYIVEGKAELTVGSSPPTLHTCTEGVHSSAASILTIRGISWSSDCRISFTVSYLKQLVDEGRQSLSHFSVEGVDGDENLHIVYEHLLSSGKYPDLTFVIGDEVIPAHKAILAARVPYFDKMLSSGMEEAETGLVKLDEGTDVAAFKEILKYIYGGQLPATLNEDAVQILPLADQYDLARLKDACFYHMQKGLTKENICETLILADLYRGSNLKKECLQQLHQWGSSLESKVLEKLSEHPRLMIEVIQSK